MKLADNWPKIVLLTAPLLIVIVAGSMLIYETLQPETKKAIRLVQESNSRKENFTVQQYLYSTVYYRQDKGEPVTIEGWRADKPEDEHDVSVEFAYSDSLGRHVATWKANVKQGSVVAQNDAARDLSWH
jgi:hypothetical protein